MWAFALITLAACGRVGFVDHASDAASDSASDSAHDSNAVTCSPSFEVCDSFESGMLPLWTAAGTTSIDTTVAHRGGASLHVHLPVLPATTGAQAVLIESQTLATLAPFWVRVWVRIAALPELGNSLEIISAEQPGSPSLGDYVFFRANEVDIYSQFTGGVDGTTVGVATDTWLCLLWHVVPLPTANGQITLDGDIQHSLSYTGETDGTPSVSDLVLGMRFSSTNVTVAQPALDMWLDDVIIDHVAVTCAD